MAHGAGRGWSWPGWAIGLIPVAVACWLLWTLFALWGARLPHPFDLEWMEGGMLVHAWRVQQGLPLYVEPGPEFIPFIYPPGYSWVLAGCSWATGLDYWIGRLVSLVGTLAAASAIVYGVVRQGEGRAWSALAGGLAAVVYLGTYPSSGTFFDLVRPDGLAMGLLAWSLVLSMEQKRSVLAVSGLLLCAAFVVKHHTAAWGLAMVAGVWLRQGWRDAAWWVGFALLPSLLFTCIMQWATDGHFLTYLVEVPGAHPTVFRRVFPGMAWELGRAMPVAGLIVLVYAISRTMRGRYSRWVGLGWAVLVLLTAILGCELSTKTPTFVLDRAWLSLVEWIPGGGIAPVRGLRTGGPIQSSVGMVIVYVGAGVGAVWLLMAIVRGHSRWKEVFGLLVMGTSVVVVTLMRGHHGGYLNVYMPLHWTLALGVGMVAARAAVGAQAPRAWMGIKAAVIAGITLSLCYATATLQSDRYRPTDADREAGQRMVEAIAELEPPVLSPFAPWLPVQAGFEPGFHLIALWDVAHKTGPYPNARQQISDEMKAHYWGTVIDSRTSMKFGVGEAYRRAGTIAPKGRAMTPKAGWTAKPSFIRVPRKER